MRGRRGAHLGLGLVVAVAVGSVLGLVAGARRADSAFDRYLAASELPDVLVSTGVELPPALAAALATDPRIVRVEQAVLVLVAPAPLEPSLENNGGSTIVGVDSLTGGFGRPDMRAGRFPGATAVDEIAVNERAADLYGFAVGQRVPLRALGCPTCPPEPAGEATIVGIVRLPTDLSSDPGETGVAFASAAFLTGRDGRFAPVGTWIGVKARDVADVPSLIADLSVRDPDGDVADTRAVTASLRRPARWQHNALLVAAAVVGVAGLLALAYALTRQLAGRPDDPRVLAAVGTTPREICAAGILAVAPAVAAGLVAAVGVAIAASPLLPVGHTRLVDPDPGVHVDLPTLLVGGGVAVVLLVAVTVLAAARWAAPARSDSSRVASPVSRLTAGLGLGPVTATGIRFALMPGRGRSRIPVVLVMSALCAACGIVVAALVVRWSLDGLVGTPARYGQDADLRVSFPPDSVDAGARRLRADPRVRDVVVARNGEVNVTAGDGRTVQIATTGLAGLNGPAPVAALEGRAPLGPREIALAPATMHALGLHVGDHTATSGPCGSFEVAVVGRVIVPLTANNYPDDGSVVTAEGFDELCAADLGVSYGSVAGALVRLVDANTVESVATEWRAGGLVVNGRSTPNSVSAVGEIRPVVNIGAALIGVLGVASLAQSLVLGVRRRCHELAVLRALGLRPGQTAQVVLAQAATLATVAVGIGVPLGLALGRGAWLAIARPSYVVVHVDVNTIGLALVALSVGALAVIVSLWPARRAARLRPAVMLRDE
jgi:hypothetical protein